MAPTIFRAHGFRFFFFSREESRLHVHVSHAEGEAKFWLEPEITLAQNIGLWALLKIQISKQDKARAKNYDAAYG